MENSKQDYLINKFGEEFVKEYGYIIADGCDKKIIKIEGKSIYYPVMSKPRNIDNPEEKVQAETYIKLIENYNYSPDCIKMYETVQMGSETKEADIIVYKDKEKMTPYIVIECKKQEITESEFTRAVEQCFSYAFSILAEYAWTTSGIKDAYFEVPKEQPRKREAIADIPIFGVKELPTYKYAKNGDTAKEGQRLFDLSKVDENELTRRFKQAHQALWGGGELNPSEAFDELDKLIFCKIWDEHKARKNGEPYDFQVMYIKPKDKSEDSRIKADKETTEQLTKRIYNLYEEGRKKSPEVFKDNIRLTPFRIRTVVGYLESINLSETDLDSKGRAFETFMGSYFRGDFGQYFTPRRIVQFMVDSLPIEHESFVLDTSCGSGGFLLYALDKVRKQAGDYYNQKTVEYYKHWHDFAENNLFGIEISEGIARSAKMNMIIHDDGHTNVVAHDGLADIEVIASKTGRRGFKKGRFDFILTNPPFGAVVRENEKNYFKNYELSCKDIDWITKRYKAIDKITLKDTEKTEVLFLEQAHNFLADDGIMAIVLPDGILTNSSAQPLRDWIMEKYRLIASVSLPQTAFTANGAGVKSSILFLQKYSIKKTQEIRNLKTKIQDQVFAKYSKSLKQLEADKKAEIKILEKNIEDKDALKIAKEECSADFADKINDIKDTMQEEYLTAIRKQLEDYPIFMAIAEDIGYDATGRETGKNELEQIAPELNRFIQSIKEGKDRFFH